MGAPTCGDGPEGAGAAQARGCAGRVLLDQVADKWSLGTLVALGGGELRFSELKRRVDGVSQRMLTVTLRSLERDGIVTRTVHSAMPPNVAYRLTPLGVTLERATAPLMGWAADHLVEVEAARADYDRRRGPPVPGRPTPS